MLKYQLKKRWYVDSIPKRNEHIYGAIELSAIPWKLKSWKKISGDWENEMNLDVISSPCDSLIEVDVNNVTTVNAVLNAESMKIFAFVYSLDGKCPLSRTVVQFYALI